MAFPSKSFRSKSVEIYAQELFLLTLSTTLSKQLFFPPPLRTQTNVCVYHIHCYSTKTTKKKQSKPRKFIKSFNQKNKHNSLSATRKKISNKIKLRNSCLPQKVPFVFIQIPSRKTKLLDAQESVMCHQQHKTSSSFTASERAAKKRDDKPNWRWGICRSIHWVEGEHFYISLERCFNGGRRWNERRDNLTFLHW